jgi:hypothetical protein
MFNNPELVITFIAGGAAFLMQFATVVWKLGRLQASIEERIHEVERDTDDKINMVQKEMLQGQVVAATTFLRKDSFNAMMTNIDSRLIRFEGKLDSAMNDFIRRIRGEKD